MLRGKWLICFLTAMVALTVALGAQSPQAAPVAAIRAGRLFDTRSGRLLPNQVVLVQGERIAEVGPADQVRIPAGAEQIDLSQATVLPGLIDGHTHIYDSLPAGVRVNTSREAWTLLALKEAQSDLRAGFTTLRDVSTHGEGYGDVDVRNAIQRGLFEGPRMQVSTRGLNTGPIYLGAPGSTIPAGTENITGADEAREAVREQIHYGADWIKIYATAGYRFRPSGELWVDPTFTLSEVEAIVDEAHRHHRRVACHAFGGEGLRNCIVAGVDSIEHGEALDDAEMTMMLQKGIYLEPTLHRYCMPEVVERDNAMSGGKNSLCALSKKVFRAALARGLMLSFGSGVDGNPYRHGTQANEFVAMVQAGMTPVQAILSSVKVAAEMTGWQDQIGSIEKGKYADIIAVSGNPLEDITELERVKFVMKGGSIIRNDLK